MALYSSEDATHSTPVPPLLIYKRHRRITTTSTLMILKNVNSHRYQTIVKLKLNSASLMASYTFRITSGMICLTVRSNLSPYIAYQSLGVHFMDVLTFMALTHCFLRFIAKGLVGRLLIHSHLHRATVYSALESRWITSDITELECAYRNRMGVD